MSSQINLIISGEHKKVYWGRGSFGFVKVQLYRGLKVAVKEFLLRCIKEDVKREATFLCHFCHLYLHLKLLMVLARILVRVISLLLGRLTRKLIPIIICEPI